MDSADGVRRDHRLRLPADATVGGLAAALEQREEPDAERGSEWATAAAPVARSLYLNGTLLDPAARVVGTGVREGVLLGLGAPAPAADLVRQGDDDGLGLAEVHVVSGPGAGRTWRLGPGSHEIGSDPLCAIRLNPGEGVPARGLWVTVAADGSASWHRTEEEPGETVRARVAAPPPDDAMTALRRARPARVDTERTAAPGRAVPWAAGEDLTVGAVLLRLCALVEPDAAVTPSADGYGVDYNRPPRIAPHLDAERVRLPAQPTPPGKRSFPLLMMLAPLVLGLFMVSYSKSYYYLAIVVLSPMMMVSNWATGRRAARKDYEEAERQYVRRKATVEADLREGIARERRVRDVTGPDPAAVALIATGPGGRLWERRRHDPDHLVLRLGTADQPSVRELEDPSRDMHHTSIRWNIPDTPVGVDIPAHGVVGLAGPAAQVLPVARWLVVQAAVLHSPRDLRIVVLTEPERAADWAWLRWLPHLRPAGAGPVVLVGNDADSTGARVGELVSQIQARKRAAASERGATVFSEPDVLVIADGARRLRDVPGMVQVLTEGPRVRVFSVCLDEQARLLPEESTGVVLADGGRLTVRRPGAPDVEAVRADQVTPQWCEQVARALAPVRDVSPEHDAGLPQQVRLLDLLNQEPPNADAIREGWRARPASTSFVIGSGFDGEFLLDLVKDGPHGLVAGTTGSGKSELLQTFVVSLAAANRPDELTFVLVDYKGGSAFKECAHLPHTLGMVTDLDAHLVERALESLSAELRRREHVLAAADAKDHPEYQAKRAVDPGLRPLPRLLLVIDEFATLVREVPDFVPGLIGIAQRGRSLGIHLILATQRPAGVVTGDIRANTNLRIALRVTDEMESQDIIDTREAATISSATPGRALIRRGPRSADPFQTAWVGAERPRPKEEGAHADEADIRRGTVRAAELSWEGLGRSAGLPAETVVAPFAPRSPAPTDLQALVDEIRTAADTLEDFTPESSPWLPALSDALLLEDLDALGASREGRLLVPYAMEDLPALQQRRVAVADLSSFGHLYVIGAPRSGRTQVLRTLAGSAARETSCADVHLYGIDAGGGGLAAIAALPHCGGVVSRHDTERLGRLLRRLNKELTDRQELAQQHDATDITELRRLLPEDERPAHILLLVDGWDALQTILDEHDHGVLAQETVRLVREGAAAGIHLVATSERVLLGGRMAAHNDHKLLLRQGDRNDYQAAGLMPGKIPSSVPPGRGWHVLSGTETQVALLARGGGTEQAEALRTIGDTARKRDVRVPRRRLPFQIPSLPRSVEFPEAYDKVAAGFRRPLWGLLGLGGDEVEPVGVDLAGSSSVFGVLGPAGSGRSNALASLAVSLLAGGTSLVLLTPRESPLRALARHRTARVFTGDPSAEDVQAALDALPGPRVVVVDDADLLMTPAADKVLKEIVVSGRDRGLGLVYAASADSLQSGLSGWTINARRARRGLLLSPKTTAEGDLIGMRLTPSVLRGGTHVGRGWTAGPGSTLMAVQIPLTTLRAD
ncbi:FtsK/SpoIIIE domain-containing protein [Streptomyces gibsoniae]|uniref:FtsK/SpoIIIE domain-containing protein n=1 Tax=Streptomyces gibsoniae TaxID=3075529 RepID=A0ABU2TPT0_9ACTN|nr:FtsK/SpoIIIE domain-containing protein [Streptomyces sp. DSM 41699]MDT0462965.1 FtsK/SpoIIIE domain-containing protein [Streptomyces sp. DSM 41699]